MQKITKKPLALMMTLCMLILLVMPAAAVTTAVNRDATKATDLPRISGKYFAAEIADAIESRNARSAKESVILNDVLLPTSMGIEIPNIDPENVYQTVDVYTLDPSFSKELSDHGIYRTSMSYSEYDAIESTWVLPKDMCESIQNAYPELNLVDISSVHVNNQTLSVELQSSGEGRCTLDDVKAIQNIYTVIHAQSLADKIRNVKIEIVDRTGTVIYDETEADVSSKVENDLAQTTTADTEIIADRDILQEARNVLADTSYSIQSVNISDAEEITGKCLNLTLTLSNADDSSVSRISSVYDNLESYSLSTGAITQCNITLLNDEQECIAYMIGDFQYGNCIAWISPDYENAFVAQEGPQPDN